MYRSERHFDGEVKSLMGLVAMELKLGLEARIKLVVMEMINECDHVSCVESEGGNEDVHVLGVAGEVFVAVLPLGMGMALAFLVVQMVVA